MSSYEQGAFFLEQLEELQILCESMKRVMLSHGVTTPGRISSWNHVVEQVLFTRNLLSASLCEIDAMISQDAEDEEDEEDENMELNREYGTFRKEDVLDAGNQMTYFDDA